MPQESIVDASRPNAGRIYDYLLGGSHNFEVDRQAADQLRLHLPFLPKTMRLQRWCLQDLGIDLTENRGLDILIDFASGLPTNDHIHHVVPPGTKVIYSDHDPVVVEYAHEILSGTPDTYFFQADANNPEELLNRDEVKEIIGDQRNVGLIYWGVAGFLSEEGLAHAMRFLYGWSGPKATVAFNAQGSGSDTDDPEVEAVLAIYKQMGSALELRPLDTYRRVIQPWKLDERGFIPLLEWHGLDIDEMTPEEVNAFGPGGGGYGAYLVK